MPTPITSAATSKFELSSYSRQPAAVIFADSAHLHTLRFDATNHRDAGRPDEVTITSATNSHVGRFTRHLPAWMRNSETSVKNPTNWSVTNPLTDVFASVQQLDLEGRKPVQLDAAAVTAAARGGALLVDLAGNGRAGYFVIERPTENAAARALLDATEALTLVVR